MIQTDGRTDKPSVQKNQYEIVAGYRCCKVGCAFTSAYLHPKSRYTKLPHLYIKISGLKPQLYESNNKNSLNAIIKL